MTAIKLPEMSFVITKADTLKMMLRCLKDFSPHITLSALLFKKRHPKFKNQYIMDLAVFMETICLMESSENPMTGRPVKCFWYKSQSFRNG